MIVEPALTTKKNVLMYVQAPLAVGTIGKTPTAPKALSPFPLTPGTCETGQVKHDLGGHVGSVFSDKCIKKVLIDVR